MATNGPSVTSVSTSFTRTVVAVSGGCIFTSAGVTPGVWLIARRTEDEEMDSFAAPAEQERPRNANVPPAGGDGSGCRTSSTVRGGSDAHRASRESSEDVASREPEGEPGWRRCRSQDPRPQALGLCRFDGRERCISADSTAAGAAALPIRRRPSLVRDQTFAGELALRLVE